MLVLAAAERPLRCMLTREDKERIVAELADVFRRSKDLLVVGYQGVDTRGMQKLRAGVRGSGGALRVVRKTLLRRALADAGVKLPEEEVFEGQVAIAYDFKDPVAVAKAFQEFRKGLVADVGEGGEVHFAIRGGVLEERALNAEDVSALARIPAKPELLSGLVGSIAAPLRGLLSVLSGTQRKFIRVLQSKVEKARSA